MRKVVVNEDLLIVARDNPGAAVFRRFPDATRAKDARHQLIRARAGELKGWAVFVRGDRLYLVAPDARGVLAVAWRKFVESGGAR